jgi:hypothetical protein
MKMCRDKIVPRGYEYAERETCVFGDIVYPFPTKLGRKLAPVQGDDAEILLFRITPLAASRLFMQAVNPGLGDDCWMVMDIQHPSSNRAIIIGPATHWLKRKE